MSSSIFEQLRANHEMAEVLESSICAELGRSPIGQKDKVLQQHVISRRVDEIVDTNKKIEAFYKDVDGLLKEEFGNIAAPPSGSAIESFYNLLDMSRKHHDRFPDVQASDSPSIENIKTSVDDVNFTAAEVWGKYVDLTELHAMYTNLVKDKPDYLQYMECFPSWNQVPFRAKAAKGSRRYQAYLTAIIDYLTSFLQRIQPLLDIQDLQKEWQLLSDQDSSSNSSSSDVRPENFESPETLQESNSDDAVKSSLERRGLKLGGTPKDRAIRLFSVRGLAPQQYPPKAVAKNNMKTEEEEMEHSNRWRRLAHSEFVVEQLADLLDDVIKRSVVHAEKQMTRSAEERIKELEEEELGMLPDVDLNSNNEDDDEDGPVYNPKNLPLGWDGKPIPFWMYKLHGLKSEFKCEVCGDEVYKGRRAFDRHFREARHAHGMKILGVPNSRHFHDLTSIQDVLNLWEKIRMKDEQVSQGASASDVEYEDANGNVWRS
eukprot:GSChrysophyteH1.ASY1.ANO1.1129.1 assembled CDS